MENNRGGAHCCGSVLTLIDHPEIAADLGAMRMQEAVDAGAEAIISLCPCCQFQFRVTADAKDISMGVTDLGCLAASALGFEFPDPDPEVRRQWAVFEAMIKTMTPEGFASMLSGMWPEVIDALPYGLGGVMRFMGRVPGALGAMKPLFPVIFPQLMPAVMPKIMPQLVEMLQRRIDMPDYMSEQMPELMPSVMSSLMPHMIGDVVPLVLDPMIEYLKGSARKTS